MDGRAPTESLIWLAMVRKSPVARKAIRFYLKMRDPWRARIGVLTEIKHRSVP